MFAFQNVYIWSCVFHFQDTEFLNVRFKALAKDALNSSHPVSTVVSTPEQVEEMFDSVSYEKVRYKLPVACEVALINPLPVV